MTQSNVTDAARLLSEARDMIEAGAKGEGYEKLRMRASAIFPAEASFDAHMEMGLLFSGRWTLGTLVTSHYFMCAN